MAKALSRKHGAFVSEYLIDLNGTQAVIRAGYAPGCARVTATRLLADANISAAIHDEFMARSLRTEITQDFVLNRLQIEALGECPLKVWIFFGLNSPKRLSRKP